MMVTTVTINMMTMIILNIVLNIYIINTEHI